MPHNKEEIDRPEEQLYEWVRTITEIECTKCGATDRIDEDYIEEFYEDGWRSTSKHCYCPQCRKKYLGKKKK